ncbi:MAG: PAS domain S-box protein [Fimbriimonadaceae bacterium]|nr:PAS domain S-box protein [Fimbriimonadaceae bacterium]
MATRLETWNEFATAQQAELARLRAENSQLRAVLRAAVRSNADLDTDTALDNILTAATEAFAADRALILLAPADSTKRVVRHSRGVSEAYRRHLVSGHVPLLRWLEQHGALSIGDILDPSQTGLAEAVVALMRDEGIRGVTLVGLRRGEQILGALVLYFDAPRPLTAGELEVAQLFGDQAALTLVHAQDYELVNQLRLVRERSEQRLQAILDRIRDIVIVWSPEMAVLVVNRAARTFLSEQGYDEYPQRLADLLPLDGCPVRQAFADGVSVVGCEMSLGGAVYAIDCHPLHDPATGELLAVVQHARDVTLSHRLQQELAANEAFMRMAMESAPVGIAYLQGPAGQVTRANRMMAGMCGVEPDELVGTHFSGCLEHDDQAAFDEVYREACEQGCGTWDGCHLRRADGGLLPVSVTLGRIEYADGQRLVQVIAKDITRRMRLQSQLVEQEKLAAIGQLASGVAHELRNPIGIIASAIYDLDEILDAKSADVVEDLSIARDEIARVQEIINNVLDFARASSQDREWVDLGALLDQTVALLRKSMATRDIEVTVRAAAVPEVWANRGALRQVALNLITNSYQATAEGGAVAVVLERLDEEHVQLTVRDTGEGIPKEVLSRIFNPFFTTKAPGRGTGLGLSIVASTVREHAGEIDVSSERGVGTTFRIKLPRRAPAVARREPLTAFTAAADELLLLGGGQGSEGSD